jgi:hypothetical protein
MYAVGLQCAGCGEWVDMSVDESAVVEASECGGFLGLLRMEHPRRRDARWLVPLPRCTSKATGILHYVEAIIYPPKWPQKSEWAPPPPKSPPPKWTSGLPVCGLSLIACGVTTPNRAAPAFIHCLSFPEWR